MPEKTFMLWKVDVYDNTFRHEAISRAKLAKDLPSPRLALFSVFHNAIKETSSGKVNNRLKPSRILPKRDEKHQISLLKIFALDSPRFDWQRNAFDALIFTSCKWRHDEVFRSVWSWMKVSPNVVDYQIESSTARFRCFVSKSRSHIFLSSIFLSPSPPYHRKSFTQLCR